MRILDKDGIELSEPDLALGHLVRENVVVKRHDAVEAEPEVTEDVLVWPKPGTEDAEKHPNDALYKRVVIKPAILAKPAWDETEDILRYVPYTDAELAEIAEREAAEEAARKEMEAAAAAEAEKRAVIEALPGKVGDLEDAAAELGVMADAAAASTTETEEAIAELGVMVAGLMEAMEAKEA